MDYKTVMTAVTDLTLDTNVLHAAITFAKAHDAHLEVLCLGLDRTEVGFYYAGGNLALQQQFRTEAEAEAQALEAGVRLILENSDALWSVQTLAVPIATAGHAVSQLARYSDVVLLGQPYTLERGFQAEGILEGALFDAHAAVLVIPPNVSAVPQPKNIVVAWNSSAEALSAIRAALPILAAASTVSITIIDPPQHGPDRSDPGGQLSLMLSRHGVRAEVAVMAKTMPRVSDVLCRHVEDRNADMLVMGAYGHSRFRESILGGATRDMLQCAGIPMLMAR